MFIVRAAKILIVLSNWGNHNLLSTFLCAKHQAEY